MSLSDYLVLAYKNDTRGRHKTVLSVISISIVIIAVILQNVISSTTGSNQLAAGKHWHKRHNDFPGMAV